MNITNTTKTFCKNMDARTVIRKLSNPESLTATVFLEAFVTAGRGYNAYKRGGEDEFRERFSDDVVSAVFWMKGVDIFNSIGDKFGKKFLKLPTTDFDVGRDELRTPFKNLDFDIKAKHDKNKAKSIINKLSAFKFTKIISATLLSTAVIGYIMPHINQKVTDVLMKRKKLNELVDKTPNKQYNVTFEEFDRRINSNKTQSFKGLSDVSHILENNTICKMLTNDVGIITGRTFSARNKDEGLEYIFRDVSSLFFYFASTPLMYSLLQKITGTKNLTDIDPVAAGTVHNKLKAQLGDTKMTSSEFKKITLGDLDKNSLKLTEKLKFDHDVIALSDLNKYLTDDKKKNKAIEMSKLQPEQAQKGRVLTKQQVVDVLKEGSISDCKFLNNIYKEHFGDNLFDKYRYISKNKITEFRENIDKYVKGIINAADKENNGIIDVEFLEKINKRSFRLSSTFRIFSLMVSAISLGWLIPKMQYKITEYRTGSKAAPMFRDYEQKM